MRRKAIAALGMAVLMTVGTCVPVLAAAGTDTSNATGTTKVTYTQPVSYTAVIPSGVTVNKDTGVTIAVSIEDAVLATGKVVKVSTDVAGGKLSVALGEDKQDLDFPLAASSSAELGGSNLSCSYTVGAPAQDFQTAGDHTATVTFTFTYGDPTP